MPSARSASEENRPAAWPANRRQANGKIRVAAASCCGETCASQFGMNTSESTYESEARCEVCPLSRVKAGVTVRIKQLCAAPELQERLRDLGFCEDQIIRLLTSQTNIICQVCNARLAISAQLAQLILVEPVNAPFTARAIFR